MKSEIVICDMCGKDIKLEDSYMDGQERILCRDCYHDIYGDEERFEYWRRKEGDDDNA